MIGYFQNIALHALDHPSDGVALQHEDAVREALPEPMFKDNWETHASHCRMDANFKALVGQAQVHNPCFALTAHDSRKCTNSIVLQ